MTEMQIDFVEQETGEKGGTICERHECNMEFLKYEDEGPDYTGWSIVEHTLVAIHRCTRCHKVRRHTIPEEGDQ